MSERDNYRDPRCWVLTQAGMDLVRPARLVPASTATRVVIDGVLARHGETRG